MSSIKDQLLQLGLVDEKQAKQAAHDKRVANRKKGGGAAHAKERRARDDAARAQRDEERARDRAREIERQSQTTGRDTQLRIAQMVESGRVPGKTGGRKRFYFDGREGRVPYAQVSDEIAEALEAGRIALVESPQAKTSLVVAETAERIAELDLRWLRVWNAG